MGRYLIKTVGSFVLGTLVVYAVWFAVVLIARPAEFILPHPSAVWRIFMAMPGELLRHTWVTTIEFGLGFLIGLAVAFGLACLSVWSRMLDAMISPMMVIMQSVPKIALAPLFIIWFGYGLGPKIVIAALVSFFPIFINLTGGMKAIDSEYLDYAATLGMSRPATIFRIRLPYAMPFFFAALKMAAIYSVVGAIVGEFVGADRGLGYIIIQADLSFNSAMLFAGIHILVALGIVLYLAVSVIEIGTLRWKSVDQDSMGYMVTT